MITLQAKAQKMFGAKYVWIIPGDYKDRWWEEHDTSCTPGQLQEALVGHFGTDVLTLSTNGVKTVSGLVGYSIIVTQM